MADALNEVRLFLSTPGGDNRGRFESFLNRLAECIGRGRDVANDSHVMIQRHVDAIIQIFAARFSGLSLPGGDPRRKARCWSNLKADFSRVLGSLSNT